MYAKSLIVFLSAVFISLNASASESTGEKSHQPVAHESSHAKGHKQVSCIEIAKQRQKLADNTRDKGYGPQAPRDINDLNGRNDTNFSYAPSHIAMNLCNIHFHKNAEHAGGEFTKYAGNGDGKGYLSGYQYSGRITDTESTPVAHEICPSSHGGLYPGDTIEIHYVFSSAQVKPGPTLKSCLSEANQNPQLRVEAQVFVLVNDGKGLDFGKLTEVGEKNGFQQALNIPSNTGVPVQYAGSTTGPGYNEVGSPYQVTWNVRPKVAKVDISSVGEWCKGNVFDEDHAHGVRNLVINPDLLSQIRK